jgi:hypothetical protein
MRAGSRSKKRKADSKQNKSEASKLRQQQWEK